MDNGDAGRGFVARCLESLRPRPCGGRNASTGRGFRARLLRERRPSAAKTGQGSGHSLLQDAAGVIGEPGQFVRSECYDFRPRAASVQHADHRPAVGRARRVPLPQYRTARRQDFRGICPPAEFARARPAFLELTTRLCSPARAASRSLHIRCVHGGCHRSARFLSCSQPIP
jgi:hypothetical protein